MKDREGGFLPNPDWWYKASKDPSLGMYRGGCANSFQASASVGLTDHGQSRFIIVVRRREEGLLQQPGPKGEVYIAQLKEDWQA